jgi:diacylglycerol kinase family enzyme
MFLAVATVVIVVIDEIDHFPQGFLVLALVLLAVPAAWHGVLRRGALRAVWLALAVACLAAAVVLILGRDPIGLPLLVLAAIGTVACARAAIVLHVHLPAAPRPSHPVLIFNPRSGGGKATKFNLADQARNRGIEPVEMTLGQPLEETVEELLAQGADAVAVAGGDGTQAQVAAVVARANLPYACIPAGTRNHFALDLGVDREDVVGALDAFVDGGERVVDLAEVNGRVFVNNVSVGLYGEAVQQAGYRNAKLRTLLDTLPAIAGPERGDKPSLRWRDSEGFTHDGGIALLISNNEYRLGRVLGSGTRPALDRGQLGVAVIGSGEQGRGVLRRWSVPSLEIDGDKAIALGLDGEAVALDPPLRFMTRPQALRVRIARQHPGCSPSAGLPEGGWDGVRMLVRFAVTGRREVAGSAELTTGRQSTSAAEPQLPRGRDD